MEILNLSSAGYIKIKHASIQFSIYLELNLSWRLLTGKKQEEEWSEKWEKQQSKLSKVLSHPNKEY